MDASRVCPLLLRLLLEHEDGVVDREVLERVGLERRAGGAEVDDVHVERVDRVERVCARARVAVRVGVGGVGLRWQRGVAMQVGPLCSEGQEASQEWKKSPIGPLRPSSAAIA